MHCGKVRRVQGLWLGWLTEPVPRTFSEALQHDAHGAPPPRYRMVSKGWSVLPPAGGRDRIRRATRSRAEGASVSTPLATILATWRTRAQPSAPLSARALWPPPD